MSLIRNLLAKIKRIFIKPRPVLVQNPESPKIPESSRPSMPDPQRPIESKPIEVLDIKNHIMTSAKQIPDPAMGNPMNPKLIVVHFTCSYNLPDTVNYFKNDVTDIHLLIDKDGTKVQMVPFNRTADHAGKSQWDGYISLNKYAIGIEMINIGPLIKQGDNYIDCYKRVHKGAVVKYPMLGYEYWEPFTEAQMSELITTTAKLCKHYAIPTKYVRAHHEVSPGRKVDVGGCINMSMDQFRRLVDKKIMELK